MGNTVRVCVNGLWCVFVVACLSWFVWLDECCMCLMMVLRPVAWQRTQTGSVRTQWSVYSALVSPRSFHTQTPAPKPKPRAVFVGAVFGESRTRRPLTTHTPRVCAQSVFEADTRVNRLPPTTSCTKNPLSPGDTSPPTFVWHLYVVKVWAICSEISNSRTIHTHAHDTINSR